MFSRRQFFSLVCAVTVVAAFGDSALAASGSDDKSENHTENRTETGHTGTEHNEGGDSDNGESESGDDGESGSSNKGSSNQTVKSGSSKGVSTTQDEARAAVKSGKAASLPLVLAYMANHFPGEVLDVKLLQNQMGFVYEVKYLVKSTSLQVVTLDARTLKTL